MLRGMGGAVHGSCVMQLLWRISLYMGTIEIERGMVKYITSDGEIYYVKQHFPPSIPPVTERTSQKLLVPERDSLVTALSREIEFA